MSGETGRQRTAQIDGDGLIGEWEERYGKEEKAGACERSERGISAPEKRIKRKKKARDRKFEREMDRSAKSAAKKEGRDAGASEEEFTRRCKMIQDVMNEPGIRPMKLKELALL